MGLPSFQEHLLGVSGRIHRRSLLSLSFGGPCSGLPFAECAPDMWGHPAAPSSAWGVSEGMLRPIGGMGKRSHLLRPLSNAAEEPALRLLGLASHPPPLGVGLHSFPQLSKTRHRSRPPVLWTSLAVSQKVNHRAAYQVTPTTLLLGIYSKNRNIFAHHIHNSTIRSSQNGQTKQVSINE